MDELSSEATGGSNGRRMVTRLLSEKSVGSGGLFVSLYPHCHSGMLTKSGTLLSFTSVSTAASVESCRTAVS